MALFSSILILFTACQTVCGNASQKYKVGKIDSSIWTPEEQSITPSLATCVAKCSSIETCFAAAYDEASRNCQMGPPLATFGSGSLDAFVDNTYYGCPSQFHIDSGFQLINGKYYAIVDSKQIRADAVITCKMFGGNIATFKTEQDLNAISQLIMTSSFTTTTFWTGLVKGANDGKCNTNNGLDDCNGDYYVWEDGEAFDARATIEWEKMSRVFKERSGEECSKFNQPNAEGQLEIDDVNCDWKLRPICQIVCP